MCVLRVKLSTPPATAAATPAATAAAGPKSKVRRSDPTFPYLLEEKIDVEETTEDGNQERVQAEPAPADTPADNVLQIRFLAQRIRGH